MPKGSASAVSMATSSATARTGAPNPNVIREEGDFVHHTGDTYVGSFEAKKKERTVKMLGPGTYTSAQGDSYSGIWENDQLATNEAIIASYPDGSKFMGPVSNWKYSGPGQYVYPDGTELGCNFVNNCPVGELCLNDPNGHKWLGHAQTGFALFYPVNHYYDVLEPGKEMKRRRKTVTGD